MRRRSNCFVWALCVWWILNRRGVEASLCLRRSRHVWGLHWMVWHPTYGQFIHYSPRAVRGLPADAWRKLLYHGIVRRGDAAPEPSLLDFSQRPTSYVFPTDDRFGPSTAS